MSSMTESFSKRFVRTKGSSAFDTLLLADKLSEMASDIREVVLA